MIEDEIRAALARHETLAPPTGPLRAAIDRLARRRRRLVTSAGAVLAVLAAVAVPTFGSDRATDPSADALFLSPAAVAPAGPLNLLVLGLDYHREDAGHRADTVMIAHVPADRSRAYLVALPRDLAVDIPGHGRNKLNSAFWYGSHRSGAQPDLAAGARLTAQVVTDLTGVRPTGTVAVTYQGLRAVTDAVGGVRVCLPTAVRSVHTERTFPAGCQRLDGAGARDLLRQRKGMKNGAFDRDRNAQRYLAALVDQVIDSGSDPVRLAGLLRAAERGVRVDGVTPTDLLPLLPHLADAELTGIGWSFEDTRQGPPPVFGEQFDPALAGSLFDALRRDALADWVLAHPAHVTDLD